ncbi:putative ATP-grasp-modified RiPP [Streptosporangium sp. NPDC049046]|uniref:putative ATP-grasp-modified RiPP n=1 Tax=Streptosporangium sp. NPDC049046 TaxID=3155031 RepID=UPI0034341963
MADIWPVLLPAHNVGGDPFPNGVRSPAPRAPLAEGAPDMSNSQTMRPWGLSRMTERLPEAPASYETFKFDPDTQLTNFYDASGAIVDMGKDSTNRNFVTVTVSRGGGGDGSGGASQTADDSQNDSASD